MVNNLDPVEDRRFEIEYQKTRGDLLTGLRLNSPVTREFLERLVELSFLAGTIAVERRLMRALGVLNENE
jgi:hypothetical protein